MKTSATRFSDRVEEYIKYRPGYPQQVIEILKEEIDLNPVQLSLILALELAFHQLSF